MFVDVWWFILLPVLFGLGWLAAKLDARDSRRQGALPGAYFKGLNFLLNEQPDEAIDAFIDVVQLEPETTELHFALGNLFRRRGETERAIRVHKNLVERSDISESQRQQATFELGQDYLKSGLLDRAEEAFDRLTEPRLKLAALNHRLQIAQMVRDWPQAIELASEIQNQQPGADRRRMIAHFHCERAAALAEKTGDESHPVAVGESLDTAVSVDPQLVRPWLLRGELAHASGDHEAAIKAWQQAFELAPRYAALVAGPWLAAHQALGRTDDGIAALKVIQQDQPSVDLLIALHEVIQAHRNNDSANKYLTEALSASPSLLGFQQLINTRLADSAQSSAARAELELSQKLVSPQADRLSRYMCGQCGFSARRYYWQCPGCSQWDTYPPRRAEELERG